MFKWRLDKYWGNHRYSLDPSIFVWWQPEWTATVHRGLTSKALRFHGALNKLHRLSERDSRLAHSRSQFCAIWWYFESFGIFGYFRCKIWRQILVWRPRFPIKAKKFCAYLAYPAVIEITILGRLGFFWAFGGIWLLPVQNLTSVSCSATPISYKGEEISRLSRLVIQIPTSGHFGVWGFCHFGGVFSYFWGKIWRNILALWPWFPIRVTKFRAYLPNFGDLTRDR